MKIEREIRIIETETDVLAALYLPGIKESIAFYSEKLDRVIIGRPPQNIYELSEIKRFSEYVACEKIHYDFS